MWQTSEIVKCRFNIERRVYGTRGRAEPESHQLDGFYLELASSSWSTSQDTPAHAESRPISLGTKNRFTKWAKLCSSFCAPLCSTLYLWRSSSSSFFFFFFFLFREQMNLPGEELPRRRMQSHRSASVFITRASWRRENVSDLFGTLFDIETKFIYYRVFSY